MAVEFKDLTALRLDNDGNLLACDSEWKQIKVIDPAGRIARTIELPFGPEAVDVAGDGTIYCGGQGKLAKLDRQGDLLKIVDVPADADAPVSETARRRAEHSDVDLRLRVSGLAVTDEDVFFAFGTGWSTVAVSKLFRLDRDLENPKMLAEKLRGCCQRCDLVAHNGDVLVAENSAFRVVRFSREGELVGKWGERARAGLEGFGACCNPMNLCLDSGGRLYTAESGLGRIKCYAPDGTLLGLTGYVGTQRFASAGRIAAACSNIALAVTPDGSRIYVMDYQNSIIRVLQRKGSAAADP